MKQLLENKNYGWLLWSLGAIFSFMGCFMRISPSVITKELMVDLHANTEAIGGISAYFYLAYTVMQVPVGVIVDRFGTRLPMTIAVALSSIGCLVFAMSSEIGLSDTSRFVMGFGAAFAFVGTLKWIAEYFPADQLAKLTGITLGLCMVGAAAGDAPIAYIFHNFGWRNTMVAIAAFLLILAIAVGFIAHDKKKEKSDSKEEGSSLVANLLAVLKNKQIWINCLFIGFLYAPTAAFGGLWGVTYLSAYHKISTTTAAVDVGMIYIGLAIGCPLFGWLSDKWGKRLPLMRISAIGSLLLMSGIIYTGFFDCPPSVSNLIAPYLCFFYGVFNSGISPSFAVSVEILPSKLTGIATGVTNMANVGIGAILIPIIGGILAFESNGILVHGEPKISTQNFQLALLLLPACFILALILSFLIKETNAKPVQ